MGASSARPICRRSGIELQRPPPGAVRLSTAINLLVNLCRKCRMAASSSGIVCVEAPGETQRRTEPKRGDVRAARDLFYLRMSWEGRSHRATAQVRQHCARVEADDAQAFMFSPGCPSKRGPVQMGRRILGQSAIGTPQVIFDVWMNLRRPFTGCLGLVKAGLSVDM